MRLTILSLAALAWLGCEKVQIHSQQDAGPACEAPEVLVQGQCRVVCHRDGECQAGQRCELLTGTCVPRPVTVDSGTPPIPCTEGAVRCASDGAAVERCNAAGAWVIGEQCVLPDGYCSNEQCLRCHPGASRCADANTAELCLDDGSDFRQVACAPGATCTDGQCGECTLGDKRCSPDGHTLEACSRTMNEADAIAWQPAGDNFDGACITQVCQQGASGPECQPPACIPGAQSCVSSTTQQLCSATGAWVSQLCSALPNMGPGAECLNGSCVDECADAARANSYFGCEYWTTVLENGITPAIFKGGLSGKGLGTSDSEFAFVVSNRSTAPATVQVKRKSGGSEQIVKTVTVPGRTDPTTRGVLQINVPWHHTSAPNDSLGTSGRNVTAYHLTASRPVTVYQFNPLSAVAKKGACTSASQCTLMPSGYGQTCVNGTCNYYSYSNDASLLLPAHILGTSYVGLTMEHEIVRDGSNSGAPQNFGNGSLVIVAPQDGTTVTVKTSAKTLAAADSSVPALSAGQTSTFTLAAYEVLQLSSDLPANVVSGSTAGNLECADNPYDTSLSCVVLGNCSKVCRVAGGDLTGTIITADKPIAVFGASACALRGYADTACDHVEEQLFPFATWGKNFVAARTAPLRLSNNAFASAGNAGPDYYKIVAGCPSSVCPNGTTLTLSTPPAAGDVLSGSNGCASGTSLAANNCRLGGGQFVEFRSKTSFRISADQPIQVAQIFAGQNATGGSTRPVQGDPSIVLLPPVEQWRANYTVLTAPGTQDNYLGVTIDTTRVASVKVDGATITSGWTAVTGTTFQVANVPVQVGGHTIEVVPQANQTQTAGAGVTVYGFDEYVSYGYTGGLDLQTIVPGVTPGG